MIGLSLSLVLSLAGVEAQASPAYSVAFTYGCQNLDKAKYDGVYGVVFETIDDKPILHVFRHWRNGAELEYVFEDVTLSKRAAAGGARTYNEMVGKAISNGLEVSIILKQFIDPERPYASFVLTDTEGTRTETCNIAMMPHVHRAKSQ